jgi:hypothetical protein
MASAQGRHRGERVRMSRVRLAALTAVVAAATAVAVGGSGSTAAADAPVQTAWWNAFSGGGQAAPVPTTPEGGLHVSVAPDQVLAYSAVLYLLPEGASGTLELDVAGSASTPVVNPNSPSTDPAISVVACPTTETWKAGDDQPMDAAPEYDCSTRQFVGNLSADAKTVTFLVDDGGQLTPGQVSLAIVPRTTDEAPGVGTKLPVDATQPYSLDFAKPDAASLLVLAAPVEPADPGDASTDVGVPAGDDTADGSTQTTTSGGGVPVPPTVGSGALPGAGTSAGVDPAPVVAPSGQPAPAAAPVAATAPSSEDTAHNLALALLIALGVLIAATSNGQLPRAPRLLGGTGRHAAAGGAAAAAAAAAAAVPLSAYGSRGLGRFAKARNEPPRPLL